MSQSRFVHPQEKTLTLANGDTLTVRRRLTAGEQLDMFERLYLPPKHNPHPTGNGRMQLNPVQTGLALIVAYVLDWSLCDESGTRVIIRGEPIDVVEAAIRQLDPDDFNEVKQAIEAHDAEVKAASDRKKKGTPTGELESSAISESPSGAGGASNG